VFPPGEYRGVPYDWGGGASLTEFDAAIARGAGAGSRASQGFQTCNTGVDCSGLLSVAWGLPKKYGTGMLARLAPRLGALADLKPGDALKKAGSHVVIWAGRSALGQPVYFEASSAAMRVRLFTGWPHLRGMTPVRYRKIRDSAPVGALVAAREIDRLPYQDQRWSTAGAGSAVERWPCAPDLPFGGPEVWYRLRLDAPARVSLRLSHDAGIRRDRPGRLHLFLSQRPAAEGCIDHDATDLSAALEPGLWWLAVDSSDQQDGSLAAPYILSASAAPVERLPPEAPPRLAVVSAVGFSEGSGEADGRWRALFARLLGGGALTAGLVALRRSLPR
jgi:hypothetical protein